MPSHDFVPASEALADADIQLPLSEAAMINHLTVDRDCLRHEVDVLESKVSGIMYRDPIYEMEDLRCQLDDQTDKRYRNERERRLEIEDRAARVSCRPLSCCHCGTDGMNGS